MFEVTNFDHFKLNIVDKLLLKRGYTVRARQGILYKVVERADSKLHGVMITG